MNTLSLRNRVERAENDEIKAKQPASRPVDGDDPLLSLIETPDGVLIVQPSSDMSRRSILFKQRNNNAVE